GVGNPFLDLGADGAIVDQSPALDDFRAMVDGNLGILEETVVIVMADAQFRKLAGGARYRRLMTLAAGLRVVQRSESIRSDLFDLVKEFQVRLAAIRVGETVALIIKSSERLGRLGGRLCTRIRKQGNEQPTREEDN